MEQYVQKCWEFMRCGIEFTCSVYPNCGEECWRIAGTKRYPAVGTKSEGSMKKDSKDNKDNRDVQDIPNKRKRCKYIIRYGICQCCPYFQYMEKNNRNKKTSGGMEF